MVDLPASILFACDRNTIRSPMAEAITKHLVGHRIQVVSAGVQLGDMLVDGFAIMAMQEIGLDISDHQPKAFEALGDMPFDLIITFTPQAQHQTIELTRTRNCEIGTGRPRIPGMQKGRVRSGCRPIARCGTRSLAEFERVFPPPSGMPELCICPR